MTTPHLSVALITPTLPFPAFLKLLFVRKTKPLLRNVYFESNKFSTMEYIRAEEEADERAHLAVSAAVRQGEEHWV